MTRQIYRVENAENFSNAGAAIPYLTYEKPDKNFGDKLISKGGDDATLEELVGLCDHDAEGRNVHDFCGSHRLLGGVLYRILGRRLATQIMLDIARRGGQHGMGGIGVSGDAYKDLGVGECEYDWDGNYGD